MNKTISQISLDLFSNDGPSNEPPKQLLDRDGDSKYFGQIYSSEQSNSYLNKLLEKVAWKNDEAIINGKHYITDRKIAWYGDQAYANEYSGTVRFALNWIPELLEIKAHIESISKTTYNSCLLNLYDSGNQGMGWHSDNETFWDKNANIASLSLGAERRFDFRHIRSNNKVSVLLEHGSLLVMSGKIQSHWKHQLPKTTKITEPRVNLTFRRIINSK